MSSIDAIQKLQEYKKYNKFYSFSPYKWQKDFYAAGKTHKERILMAGNRVGKTSGAAFEVSCHATGDYPDWWDGVRFDHIDNILIWVGSQTNEQSRDIIQKELLGGIGDEIGTGIIPKASIKTTTKRQCGVSDVVDMAKVRHKNGSTTTIVFKSYEQGWQRWQGTAPHVVWMDEEPDDYKIYTEARTRIITSKGVIMVTFTPLSGRTDLVVHFEDADKGTYMKNVTWDDAPHLTDIEKEEAIRSFPSYEIEARTKGVPIMGQGRIFPIDEETIKCKPFSVPDYYFRIIGVDFGFDHPAGTVLIAWDRDTDIIYVVDAHKKSNMKVIEHSKKIKSMGGDIHGGRIPVAWPHDGENREPRSGITLKSYYLQDSVCLLSDSARYDDETGSKQPQEPIIQEIYERMETGRFKVFEHLTEWFEEFRNYHRIAKSYDDRNTTKIVSKRDDLLKATFYAVMMKRYAVPKYFNTRTQPSQGSYLS